MRARAYVACAAIAACGLACGVDLERQSQLERVRVLAIRADPAELVLEPDTLAPLSPVRLSPLTFAPEQRSAVVSYALCRPGANVYAPEVECPGADGLTLPGGAVDLSDGGLRAYLASFGLVLAPAAAEQLTRGIVLNVGYLASDGTSGDRGTERGVYQLSVRATREPNHNPQIDEISLGEAPLQGQRLPLGRKVTFTPSLAPGSVETYVDADGQMQVERIVYSWFATGSGKVEDFRSQEPYQGIGKRESEYTSGQVAEDVTLYVVARDGRGGTGWIVRSFSVGP